MKISLGEVSANIPPVAKRAGEEARRAGLEARDA